MTGSRNPETTQETFELRLPDGVETRTVEIVERVKLCGVGGFALHRDGERWILSHIGTGSYLGEGSTRKEAMDNAASRVPRRPGMTPGDMVRAGIRNMQKLIAEKTAK